MKTSAMLALSLVVACAVSPAAQARKYTIYDRQVVLERKIDSAFRANQLTLKEADSLKDKLKNVKEEEQRMKQKNGGKLSYENQTSLERDLNKISEKLHKKELEKRTQ